MHKLTLAIERRGLAAVVRVEGTLDLRGAEHFDSELERLLAGRPSEVLVDLREVAFIDSIGLRSLFACHQTAVRERVPLWFVRGGVAVTRMLRMTGLDAILPLIDRLPRRLTGVAGRAVTPPVARGEERAPASP
jgi:anti-sigma B factor antagonist